MLLISFSGLFWSCYKADYQTLGTPDFYKLLSDSTVQLVDVRTSDEYREGHIDQAVNLDVEDAKFDEMAESLDIGQPVAVYCRSGKRSKLAAKKLSEKGYKVYNLEHGFLNWIETGYPSVTY